MVNLKQALEHLAGLFEITEDGRVSFGLKEVSCICYASVDMESAGLIDFETKIAINNLAWQEFIRMRKAGELTSGLFLFKRDVEGARKRAALLRRWASELEETA
jgi:hypothetical protein